MKKLLVVVAMGIFTACASGTFNNDATQDSLKTMDSLADAKKENVDSSASAQKSTIDSIKNLTNAAIDSEAATKKDVIKSK